jgi:hypothetical protein
MAASEQGKKQASALRATEPVSRKARGQDMSWRTSGTATPRFRIAPEEILVRDAEVG